MLLRMRQVVPPASRNFQRRSNLRQRQNNAFGTRHCGSTRYSFTSVTTADGKEEHYLEHQNNELNVFQTAGFRGISHHNYLSFRNFNNVESMLQNSGYQSGLISSREREHDFSNNKNPNVESDFTSLNFKSKSRNASILNTTDVGNTLKFSRSDVDLLFTGVSRGLGNSGINRNLLSSIMNANSNAHRSLVLQPTNGNILLARALFSSDTSTTRKDKIVSNRGIKRTRIPTPSSGPAMPPTPETMQPQEFANEIRKRVEGNVMPAVMTGIKSVGTFIFNLPGALLYYITHPTEIVKRWHALKKVVEDEISHYWVGSKLLWADIQTARNLLRKTLKGSSLTRRERKQLLRTVSDIFRLVPMSIFVIIPFMEFALPFALKIFPNMLPSTFQDSLKAEENMKRELQSRIAMAKFFQETLEELAKEQKRKAAIKIEEIEESGDEVTDNIVQQQEESAASMLEFLEKARNGEVMPPDIIVKYANYFQDDLTLDNMPRMQLVNMCRYMSIPPYGSDSFLSFQLRHKIRSLKEDDQRILWEGIDSLTKMELREACQERGMRSTGLSKDAYRRALQQWLDLSVHKSVPISLLVMSRSFFLREEMFSRGTDDASKSLTGLADAISGMDKEVVNEVILEVATSEERMSDPSVRKIQLEVLTQQNERIREEAAQRAKKKEAAEREKQEIESSDTSEPIAETKDSVAEVSADDSSGAQSLSFEDAKSVDRKTDDEEDRDLSTEELEAISQIVSSDPVSKERAELESIKAAMAEKIEPSEDQSPEISHAVNESSSTDTTIIDVPIQKDNLDTVEEKYFDDKPMEATPEAEESIKAAIEGGKETVQAEVIQPATEPEDPVVARLKKRVEKMVNKIELQLSDVQVKIGDKLHFLDKDMDGILTREEFAAALQEVLKREISLEEALEFAKDVDYNGDGKIEVQELIRWIETNTMVKFVEEGRDADIDRILEKQSSEMQNEEQMKLNQNGKK